MTNASSSATGRVVSMGVVRRELKAAIEGNAPWSVRLGHGTSVFFDFGEREPSEVAGTPDRGSDQLWIYSASWRLFGSLGDGAGSGDEESRMEAALTGCVGQSVSRVRFDSDLNLSLHFNGAALTFRTLRCSSSEDAWTLFRSTSAFSLTAEGTIYRETSTP